MAEGLNAYLEQRKRLNSNMLHPGSSNGSGDVSMFPDALQPQKSFRSLRSELSVSKPKPLAMDPQKINEFHEKSIGSFENSRSLLKIQESTLRSDSSADLPEMPLPRTESASSEGAQESPEPSLSWGGGMFNSQASEPKRVPVTFEHSDEPSDLEKRIMAAKKAKEAASAPKRKVGRIFSHSEEIKSEPKTDNGSTVQRQMRSAPSPIREIPKAAHKEETEDNDEEWQKFLSSLPSAYKKALEPTAENRPETPPSEPVNTVQRALRKDPAPVKNPQETPVLRKSEPVESTKSIERPVKADTVQRETVPDAKPITEKKEEPEPVKIDTVQREVVPDAKPITEKKEEPEPIKIDTVQQEIVPDAKPITEKKEEAEPVRTDTVQREVVPNAKPLIEKKEEAEPVKIDTVQREVVPNAKPITEKKETPEPVKPDTVRRETLPNAKPITEKKETPKPVKTDTVQRETVPNAKPLTEKKETPEPVKTDTVQREIIPDAKPLTEKKEAPEPVKTDMVQREIEPDAKPITEKKNVSVKADTVQREIVSDAKPIPEKKREKSQKTEAILEAEPVHSLPAEKTEAFPVPTVKKEPVRENMARIDPDSSIVQRESAETASPSMNSIFSPAFRIDPQNPVIQREPVDKPDEPENQKETEKPGFLDQVKEKFSQITGQSGKEENKEVSSETEDGKTEDETEEKPKKNDLDALAEELLPRVKRMLANEFERTSFY